MVAPPGPQRQKASADAADAARGRAEANSGSAASRPCPLCDREVAAAGEAARSLNRHFETECTWRHTSRSPLRPSDGP